LKRKGYLVREIRARELLELRSEGFHLFLRQIRSLVVTMVPPDLYLPFPKSSDQSSIALSGA
jgi:hypothetical protein